MESLNLKYRPHEFKDVNGQTTLVKILERQVETNSFKNCIILSGPSGCGKTTLARIFANKINKGLGQPIEIDGASNNGVDNVRQIIDSAQERSLDSEYKIYIIDECHMITTQAWNAMLKLVEEPPKYTLFFFCTTDPQKIPQTIVNRCQVFTLSRVNNEDIKNRLSYICSNEGISFTQEGIELLTKAAQGSMRQAIAYLDKLRDYNNSVSKEEVIECLGNFSYDVFFNLTNSLVDNNKQQVISIIEDLYNKGTDLKLFINNYLEFVLQLNKYILYNSLSWTSIPEYLEKDAKYSIGIENNAKYFKDLMELVLDIKNSIRGDQDPKTTIEVMLMKRGE